MNQLETLIIPTETVEFNGQKLEVRGLSLPDITFIIRQHRNTVSELYVQAIDGKLSGSVEEIALTMLDDFVPLASLAIACAMDSPKHPDKAARLPLSVQAELLATIFQLTVEGEGGLEKLMEIVVRAAAGTARLSSPKT